ncbi:hypothetical protein D3C78_1564370 [compost metagenome]
MDQAFDALLGCFGMGLVFLKRRLIIKMQHLKRGLNCSKRCSELMGGASGKSFLPGEGTIQPIKHCIEGERNAANFILSGRNIDPR